MPCGLVDFWHWEYDYGHRLDFEHAIIKIPGMSYQPPLIGVKQLLNFTAVSWPDVGGWLAFSALRARGDSPWLWPFDRATTHAASCSVGRSRV